MNLPSEPRLSGSVTRYPAPLTAGSNIAITAFSSGVTPALEKRLSHCLAFLQSQGYNLIEGKILRQPHANGVVPASERAAELMAFLLDDSIDAIMPPWGGELAMEVLPLLDFAALKTAKPKWVLGYSDVSTVSACLAATLHWGTVHCANLMELTPNQDDPLTSRLFAHLQTPAGGHFCQVSSSHYQKHSLDFAAHPTATFNLTEPTRWQPVNFSHNTARFSGRLIGGCLDTLMHLMNTPWLDMAQFAQHHRDSGVILYLENVEQSPNALKRALIGLQLRGIFDNLNGILFGRNYATTLHSDAYAQHHNQQQRDLLCEAIGDVPYPVLMDVDTGHQPPNLTLINGAMAEVDYLNHQASLTQWLV